MPQLINGNGPQILTAGSSLVSAPAQTANGLELATMSNVKSLLILGTTQAASSQLFIDYAIPVSVKRVTVCFYDSSLNGSATAMVQMGSSGAVQTTGYRCISAYNSTGGALAAAQNTTGFNVYGSSGAANAINGSITLTRISSTLWAAEGLLASGALISSVAGGVALAGELDRIRITTSNGTDVFDAGSVNILMEF